MRKTFSQNKLDYSFIKNITNELNYYYYKLMFIIIRLMFRLITPF